MTVLQQIVQNILALVVTGLMIFQFILVIKLIMAKTKFYERASQWMLNHMKDEK